MLTFDQLEYMDNKWRAWVYWFFGGKVDNSPVKAVHDMWTSCKKTMSTAVDVMGTFFSFTRKPPYEESAQGSDIGDIELPQRPTLEH